MCLSSSIESGKKNLINRILMPHDGSECADRALYWALDVAEKYGASVEIVNVISLSSSAFGRHSLEGGTPLFGPSKEDLNDVAWQMLAAVVEKAMSLKPAVKISSRLLEGNPAESIVEAAKEGECDLIVIGSLGLGGFKEFILGSVSDKVADEATCPVTIVK